MKNIINILSVLAVVFVVSSCFKDEGNYDYKQISDVTVTFEQSIIDVLAWEDGLHITPTVETTTPTANLYYIWTISKTYTEQEASYVGAIQVDTLTKGNDQKDLHINLVTLDPGMYHIYYRIDNKATGITYHQRVLLNVTTQYANGFYVMKDLGGQTDIDLFSRINPDPSFNLIADRYGASMPDPPTNMSLAMAMCFRPVGETAYSNTRALSVAAGNDIRTFNTNDLTLVYDHSTMFWVDPPVERPIGVFCNQWVLSYLSDKGYYTSYQSVADAILGAGKFSYPEYLASEATANLVPNEKYYLSMPAASSTSSSTVYGCLFLYDEAAGRFMYADPNGNLNVFSESPRVPATTTPGPVNGIRHKMLYYGANWMNNLNTQCAIFEDETDPSKRYLYTLSAIMSGTSNPITNIDVLDPAMKVNTATHYALNEKTAYMLYFVHDNMVYRYDPAAKTESLISTSDIGAGEEITYISHKWWSGTGGKEPLELEERLFDYLVVATQSGSNYKVYMYDISGATVPTATADMILQGPGKAVKVLYTSDRIKLEGARQNLSWGY